MAPGWVFVDLVQRDRARRLVWGGTCGIAEGDCQREAACGFGCGDLPANGALPFGEKHMRFPPLTDGTPVVGALPCCVIANEGGRS